ncbi:Putative lipoate-protein ligase A [Cladobotryum mycophilum]|uniref:Putative lipoate-protein ligase A n=1 Tax=Cladobotryum mycophilum TaxID=491253 RepID=A0ABR0SK14_9HYPO
MFKRLSMQSRLRPFQSLTRVIPGSSFSTEAASHPANKIQVYISKSRDPFLNLSVEHQLLQVTPPDSTILTLYTNSPSVIFGRNQNPWLEVNLSRLAQISQSPISVGWTDEPIQLVRRRSGGGTVFHDIGNVNFSVICPPAAFDRNKHAEMVVRALSALGRPNTRVNERHDIVIDAPSTADKGTFKVSGSAYKLTRLRSLHHGTCLLRSPNLTNISGLLRSPAEGFIKARGVDSVRSPVRNVDLDNADFEAAVVDEFKQMYGDFQIHQEFDDTALETEKIAQGYRELKSRSWIYGQTPRFTFSTHPTEEDPRPRSDLPFSLNLNFMARHGLIEQVSIKEGSTSSPAQVLDVSAFENKVLHDVHDWASPLAHAGLSSGDADQIGLWLNRVLGTEFTTR